MVTIPVFACRLLGTRVVRRTSSRPRSRRSAGSPYRPEPFDEGPALGVPTWVPETDRSHGTRRVPQEVAAFFAPDPGLAYARGLTVNDVWRPAGIAFRLVESVERAVDSDLADLTSTSPDTLDPVAERLGRADAVNLFLVRSLLPAAGTSSGTYAPGDGRRAYAFQGDLDDLRTTPERWGLEIMVVAHELGHLLGLPHMPDRGNLMYAVANATSTRLAQTQIRIAEARATHFPHV